MRLAVIFLLLPLPILADDWTTTSGTTYHDVKVLAFGPGYVKIQDSDGAAVIRLEKLPQEIQDALKAQADPKTTAPAVPDKTLYVIWGAVSQVTPDGLLIQCPSTEALIASGNAAAIEAAAAKDGASPVCGPCLLKDYPKQGQMVDGDRIRVLVYARGIYSYQATDGSTVTIHAYTAAPNP